MPDVRCRSCAKLLLIASSSSQASLNLKCLRCKLKCWYVVAPAT